MKFIVEPSNGVWVAIKPDLREGDLVQRLSSADILVSDLDDTDAPSPAKDIARSGLTTLSYMMDPKFWIWALGTEYHLARKGRRAESHRWNQFVNKFLRDPDRLANLSGEYTQEAVARKFYPGVREFYDSLPQAVKVYLTRNIQQVGEAYKKAAGFNAVLTEQFDKQEGIQRVISVHPERKRFIVKGDSAEDEAVVEVLTSLKRRGEIEEVTPIYVADSPHKLNPRFDVNIGRNYNGLVSLLKNAQVLQQA